MTGPNRNESDSQGRTQNSQREAICRNCGAVTAVETMMEGCCLRCVESALLDVLETEEQEAQARQLTTNQSLYTLGKRIGRGGMGTVHLGRRESDGELVAIKFIHEELAKDGGLRQRFAAESAALARLKHSNIVAHLDSGEMKGGGENLPFLVMEYVAGSDLGIALRNKSKAGETFTFNGIIQDGIAMARGLAAAHAAGFIHRDLKPSNVLKPLQGEAKLADFGLVIGGRPDEATLVASRQMGGSYFTSPELHDTGICKAQGDLFSLGAVLYNLLTLAAPRFIPKDTSAIVAKVDGGSQAQIDSLKRLILKLMEVEPHARFESAQAVELELEKILRGEVTHFPKKSPFPNPGKWAAGLACLTVAAWGGASWWGKKPLDLPDLEVKPVAKDQLEDAKAMKLPGAVFLQTGRVAVPLPPSGVEEVPPIAMENSLGMKFRPIPRHDILMCIWEMRVKDYAEFAKHLKDGAAWIAETGMDFTGNQPMLVLRDGKWRFDNAKWDTPGWPIADDQPVAGRCWIDAAAFCMWLTYEERNAGRIGPDQSYRLPTDLEWSAAAGLPMEPGNTPEECEGSWPPPTHIWPWGPFWPPPEGVVNLAGLEILEEKQVPSWWTTIPSRDEWVRVAPVEALPPSALGFHHMCGNVEEWTETLATTTRQQYILRGGAWCTGTPLHTSLHRRGQDRAVVRHDQRGFRIVFQKSGAGGWRYSGERAE